MSISEYLGWCDDFAEDAAAVFDASSLSDTTHADLKKVATYIVEQTEQVRPPSVYADYHDAFVRTFEALRELGEDGADDEIVSGGRLIAAIAEPFADTEFAKEALSPDLLRRLEESGCR